MRIACVLLFLAGLVACNRANHSNDAIRQGVLDHLAGRSLNIASMDINVTGVQYTGNKADATVVFTPKGAAAGQGMTLRYQLEQKSGRWEVVGTMDSGHTALAPGAANPHGGSVPAEPNTHGPMPSPEDLPPAGKK